MTSFVALDFFRARFAGNLAQKRSPLTNARRGKQTRFNDLKQTEKFRQHKKCFNSTIFLLQNFCVEVLFVCLREKLRQ